MRGAASAPFAKWLTARPIAHRGLHDAAAGIIENTPSAVRAAVAANYGIEVDLQITADGEAMVFHDDDLRRLTEGTATLASQTAAALKAVAFKATADRMITLSELCRLVAGRVPLVLELKSRFDGDLRVAQRTAAVLAAYAGPVAAMSFDPSLVHALRSLAPSLPRGIVAQRHFDEAPGKPPGYPLALGLLLHAPWSRPQFVAYGVKDLPAPATILARLIGCPVLTWTVRSSADLTRARRYADQAIFEGIRP